MTLTINGEKKQIDAQTVRDLIEALGLGGRAVAVELNRHVVPRRDHAHTPIHDGDELEIVTLVGGG